MIAMTETCAYFSLLPDKYHYSAVWRKPVAQPRTQCGCSGLFWEACSWGTTFQKQMYWRCLLERKVVLHQWLISKSWTRMMEERHPNDHCEKVHYLPICTEAQYKLQTQVAAIMARCMEQYMVTGPGAPCCWRTCLGWRGKSRLLRWLLLPELHLLFRMRKPLLLTSQSSSISHPSFSCAPDHPVAGILLPLISQGYHQK